jgi:hypothetical protein
MARNRPSGAGQHESVPRGAARAPTRRRNRSGACMGPSASWKLPLPRKPDVKPDLSLRPMCLPRARARDLVLRHDIGQNGVERGFAFRNRSLVSGLVRLCEEDRACDGDRLHYGALPARLSARGTPPPAASGGDRRYCARPTEASRHSDLPCAGRFNASRGSVWSSCSVKSGWKSCR